MAPPAFNGENYQIWVVRMQTYLEALDLWEVVEDEYEITPLPNNPTMAQIKNHKERKSRKSKAKACLFTAVSSTIFTRIMSLKSAKEVWDYFKTEYEGDERIRGMQVLNLVRELELQRMKESETIKEYSDRLLNIANRIRLLGSTFTDSMIVEKILVTVPGRFEATITTLENTKDLSKITLAELLSAFQAQEQRRVMRQGGVVEGALPAKHQDDGRYKKKKKNKRTSQQIEKVQNATTKANRVVPKEITLLVSIVARTDTHLSSVGKGLMLSAVSAISWGTKQSFARIKLSSKKQMLELLTGGRPTLCCIMFCKQCFKRVMADR
ncbi:uncharacterized protein LOC132050942 [Lycium ferocissimum]|uniref:uncharacterized protein LOC132050942 n=1 Tax=Lycium ferocissimum TaxID=112874 RepID=UPI002815D5C6|nr:uncharacterized protein LOC132050942 [Lycium ferocissimum]